MLFNAPMFCYYSGRRRRSIPSGPGCLHSLYLSSVDQVRTLDTFPVCFCMWLKISMWQSENVCVSKFMYWSQMRSTLICSAVCSHLSDHPEHPHGHVIEEERLPLRRSSLHVPNILALLEDDGRAVDAADLRQGSFSSPVSVYSVFGTGSFSKDGLQAGTRRSESGGRVPNLLWGPWQHFVSIGVGTEGQYPPLLVPNKRNLKQTLKLKSTL